MCDINNGFWEEEYFFLNAEGESTVFRRCCDGGERLFVGSGEQPLQDCKFLWVGIRYLQVYAN
jgi:hypothetical protein